MYECANKYKATHEILSRESGKSSKANIGGRNQTRISERVQGFDG